MRVASLGFRTDLALRHRGGAEVVERESYLVVRTPSSPNYWWGNFILLSEPPRAGQAVALRSVFRQELPSAAHLAFGVDGTSGEIGDAITVATLGLKVNVSAVLTAHVLRKPPSIDPNTVIRRLVTDDDWEQAVALRMKVFEFDEREFTARQFAVARSICECGAGAWFGAFVDRRLAAALGLLRAWPGTARYQSVETHPDYRRRGMARRLLYESSMWARDALCARELVIVADPEYHAIATYRSLGFAPVEWQVQLERGPS